MVVTFWEGLPLQVAALWLVCQTPHTGIWLLVLPLPFGSVMAQKLTTHCPGVLPLAAGRVGIMKSTAPAPCTGTLPKMPQAAVRVGA